MSCIGLPDKIHTRILHFFTVIATDPESADKCPLILQKLLHEVCAMQMLSTTNIIPEPDDAEEEPVATVAPPSPAPSTSLVRINP